jgi:hypothetical protein
MSPTVRKRLTDGRASARLPFAATAGTGPRGARARIMLSMLQGPCSFKCTPQHREGRVCVRTPPPNNDSTGRARGARRDHRCEKRSLPSIMAMLSSSTPRRACDGRSDTTSFPLLTFHAPSRDTWTRLGHAHFNKCTSRIDAARFGVLGLYIYEKTVCTRGGGGEARGGKREGKATSCV